MDKAAFENSPSGRLVPTIDGAGNSSLIRWRQRGLIYTR